MREAGKATFVSLLGPDRARQQARVLVDQAIEHLADHGDEADLLRAHRALCHRAESLGEAGEWRSASASIRARSTRSRSGHLDIIRRGAHLVDRLVIGVTTNPSKEPMFTIAERLDMVRREVAGLAAATSAWSSSTRC